jgi:hypothetical protein
MLFNVFLKFLKGGLIYKVNNSNYIVGVLSASSSRCYSHITSLFAFIPPNLAWIRGQLEADERERGNPTIS